MRSVTSLTLESEIPLPVHADGEVITRTMRRIEVRVVPGGISVLANYNFLKCGRTHLIRQRSIRYV
jgi:diacylglycerol kinase family enzyme